MLAPNVFTLATARALSDFDRLETGRWRWKALMRGSLSCLAVAGLFFYNHIRFDWLDYVTINGAGGR